MSPVGVGPHDFQPLGGRLRRLWWRLTGQEQRCRACYCPPGLHPIGWTPARPIGDMRTTRERF